MLEEFMPGILEELSQKGGHKLDFTKQVAWFAHGSWKPRHDSGFYVHLQSRPLLEDVIRRRVQALPNVFFHTGKTVTEMTYDEEQNRVTGVTFASSRRSHDVETLTGRLVVDATGRASRVGADLKRWGFDEVETSVIKTDLHYVTRAFRAPDTQKHSWDMMVLYHKAPEQTRAGMVLPIEGGIWLVTMFGYMGDHPSKELGQFLEFSKTLSTPDLYEAIRDLEPLCDGATHRFPYAKRLRYEKLPHHPRGLVATADAVCSFDPVFGQGITMAAKAATLLEQWVDGGNEEPRRFYKRLAKAHTVPWLFASIEDFRYPQVQGDRPPGLTMMQSYVSRIMNAAAKNEETYHSVIGAFHLAESPLSLVTPRMLGQAMLN